jgi:hypothetical protein
LVQASVCTTPSAYFVAPQGTFIDANRATIRALNSSAVTVVSMQVTSLTSRAHTEMHHTCNTLVEAYCNDSIDYYYGHQHDGNRSCDEKQRSRLREILCFGCPNNDAVEYNGPLGVIRNTFGLLGKPLEMMAEATGADVSFFLFSAAERSPYWTGADVAWFVLWPLPLWLLLLAPPALLARWCLRPQNSVKRELEAALDRVELEDVRRRFEEPEVRGCLPSPTRSPKLQHARAPAGALDRVPLPALLMCHCSRSQPSLASTPALTPFSLLPPLHQVAKAVRLVRCLACSLLLSGMLLLPWAPSWFILLAALPVARNTTAADWMRTKQVPIC